MKIEPSPSESDGQTTNPVLLRAPLTVRPSGHAREMESGQHAQRRCPECGLTYPVDHFASRNPRCRLCRSAYGKDHYRRNVDYYKAKARRRQKEVVNDNKEWLLKYLLEHPCIDCGETDPLVLEFDHRDASTKIAAVSALARSGYSLSAVQREVDQCDVRCANCHRRKTHEQRGWWGRARHDSNVQPFDP